MVETLSARALRRHVWEIKPQGTSVKTTGPHWPNVCDVTLMSVMDKDEQGREGKMTENTWSICVLCVALWGFSIRTTQSQNLVCDRQEK